MEDLILKRIGGLITAHSGIHVREQDYKVLSEKLWKRAQSLGLASLENYYNLLWKELEAGVDTNPKRGTLNLLSGPWSEWQELYSILTINESYFFRDKNQFRLLTEKLLPEIIQRKQAQVLPPSGDGGYAAEKPSLRIWSAGCSTGEELYSLAIVLEEMKFPWHQWNTQLIGTDISKTAIDAAQKGIYGRWSFRQVPDNIQHKYFCNHHQLFQINDSIRRRVKFSCGNLLKDAFPRADGTLFDVDLILCRNVFIYLDSLAIGAIVRKFYNSLTPQGILMTGHTELYGQDTSQFQVVSYPESIVYKRREGLAVPSSHRTIQVSPPSERAAVKIATLKQKSKPVSLVQDEAIRYRRTTGNQTKPALREDLKTALQEAEHLLKQEAYTSAITSAEKIFTTYPQCDAAVKIAAHAHANIGSYDQAKSLCQRVLKQQPLSVDMYYLLAQIAEDQNELEITKEYLRKIIYLDSSFVRAYLDLASIYEREKQPEKTKKMQAHALSLLEKLPPDAILDAHTGTTAAEWKQHLERKKT